MQRRGTIAYRACSGMRVWSRAEAAAAQACAARLGADRSHLLRQALHHHLAQLHAEADIAAWSGTPRGDTEDAVREIDGVATVCAVNFDHAHTLPRGSVPVPDHPARPAP